MPDTTIAIDVAGLEERAVRKAADQLLSKYTVLEVTKFLIDKQAEIEAAAIAAAEEPAA